MESENEIYDISKSNINTYSINTNTTIINDEDEQRNKSLNRDYSCPMQILRFFGYKIENPKDLIGFVIPREILTDRTFTDEIREYLPILREKFSSHSLTCLHTNAEEKQQFPNLNLLRQILKCNGLYLKPIKRSGGYDKGSGKKIIFREYMIVYAN